MELIEVRTGRHLDEFIRLAPALYSADPLYAPQLHSDMKKEFSPENPFFEHAEVKFFFIKGKGRVASIINRLHIERHGERAGFFGFFECVNDPPVAKALLNGVSDELRRAGLLIMRGPMNFSTNEDCGFLIEGFNEPPMLMTPYNPPYYNDLMTLYGMEKAKDLHAFIADIAEELPDKIVRVAGLARKNGITVRPVDMKNFRRDMQTFREIYNSSWEDNWGFLPLTGGEVDFLSKRLRPVVVPELALIAEVGGEPAGFLGLLPDFNFVLRKIKGLLNPFTIPKAVYYSRKIRDLRLLLFGIKKEFRAKGVDALLFSEGFRAIKKRGFKRVEFSWILEDNMPVLRLARMCGGRPYKRYRIYEKPLG